MLRTETVAATTLGLLNQLMDFPLLSQFALVGGTNLSLRLGHRISVDLDLFTDETFNVDNVIDELLTVFPTFILMSSTGSSISCQIDDVKIDILRHRYPNIRPVEIVDGIRMYSTEDVIAMKLNAVSRRGLKKDFWDLAELLDQYDLDQMLGYFSEKYPRSEPFQVIHSLTFFGDAEAQGSEQVAALKSITWSEVKAKIIQAVKEYSPR